jgi:hypothetical protein
MQRSSHTYLSAQQQPTSVLRVRVKSSAGKAPSKGRRGEGLLILLVTGGKSHPNSREVSDEVLYIVFPNSHFDVYMYIKLAGK